MIHFYSAACNAFKKVSDNFFFLFAEEKKLLFRSENKSKDSHNVKRERELAYFTFVCVCINIEIERDRKTDRQEKKVRE